MVFGHEAYQLFLAPVRTPETIAWVAMGFAVDDALARKIRDLAGVEVALGGARPGRCIARVASSAAEPAERAGALDAGCRLAQARMSMRLGDTSYLTFVQPLDARGEPVEVMLQKPMRDVLAPYRELRDALLLIDGVALLLAAVIGSVLGRSATRPLGELVRAAQRIQQGQYETAVSVSGGEEFRSLARRPSTPCSATSPSARPTSPSMRSTIR